MYPNSIYALAPKYLCRDYGKANVYTICEHGPFGLRSQPNPQAEREFRVPGLGLQGLSV